MAKFIQGHCVLGPASHSSHMKCHLILIRVLWGVWYSCSYITGEKGNSRQGKFWPRVTGLASVRVAEYWDLKVLWHLENPRWHLLLNKAVWSPLELVFSTLPKSQWQTVLSQVIEDRSCEQRCHFCPKISTGWSIIWPEREDTAAAMLNLSRVARMLNATALHTHLATDANHDPV